MGLKKILTKNLWLEVPAQNGGWKWAPPKMAPKNPLLGIQKTQRWCHETWHEATLCTGIDKKVTKNTVTRSVCLKKHWKRVSLKTDLKSVFWAPKVVIFWHIILYLLSLQGDLHETGHETTSSSDTEEDVRKKTVTKSPCSKRALKWAPLKNYQKRVFFWKSCCFFADHCQTLQVFTYPKGLQAHLLGRC